MAGNMFAKAQVVESKPKKGKSTDKVLVPVKDVELYAALCAAKDTVEAQIAVIGQGIKQTILARGITEGIRTGKVMESFDGEENGSTANLQLKKRSIASGLSDEEIELLEEHNIPLDENVQVEGCFRINPVYSDLSDERNAKMLEKVSEALESLGLPADFIQSQPKVSKTVATQKSIEAVLSLKHRKGKNKGQADEATIAALLPVVTVPAIKPKLAEGKSPFEIIDLALTPKETTKKIAAAA